MVAKLSCRCLVIQMPEHLPNTLLSVYKEESNEFATKMCTTLNQYPICHTNHGCLGRTNVRNCLLDYEDFVKEDQIYVC